MDDNLEHGGLHVDGDTEIPDNPLRPKMVGGVPPILESVQLILYLNVEVRKSPD